MTDKVSENPQQDLVYPQDDDDDSVFDDDDYSSGGCSNHLLTSGFGLGWENLNHRISLWEIYPDQPPCPESMLEDTYIDVGYIGGDFSTGDIMSDVPEFLYKGHALSVENQASFISGKIETIVEAYHYETYETLTIHSDIFREDVPAYAFISGITVDTEIPQTDPEYPPSYDPALGYTLKGFGAWFEQGESFDGYATFDLMTKFEPGPADRWAMNKAIERARIKMVVYYTVVSMHHGNATTAEHGYFVAYPPPTFLIPQHIPYAPAQDRLMQIQGLPHRHIAIPAIQGFEFDLFTSVEKGDYIRGLMVDVSMIEYDRASGLAKIDVNGYASNSSITAFETMEVDFSASVALLQFDQGTFKPVKLRESFQTGRESFSVLEN